MSSPFSPGKRTGIVRIARVCPHGDNVDTAIAIYKQIKFKLTIIPYKVYVHKYMYLDLTYTIATTLAADKSIWRGTHEGMFRANEHSTLCD